MATTLVFMEAAGDELSQQAVAFAAGLGGEVAPVAIELR